jgi:hypothetical protein
MAAKPPHFGRYAANLLASAFALLVVAIGAVWLQSR